MSRRSKAREVVLQVLYQYDLNPDAQTPVDSFVAQRVNGDRQLIQFAHSLLGGVLDHRDELDRCLIETAENWALERMAVTDRNVLRLGAYELFHTETPPRVVINEAVELAKRFGNKQSPPFVNGILDRLLSTRDAEQGNGSQTASTEPKD